MRSGLLSRWSLATIGLALIAAAWVTGTAWRAREESIAIARSLTGGDPDAAPGLVERYGCGACHTIPGLPGADGRVGPPLMELRQRVFIAGMLPNTAENLVAWIVNPPAFQPRSAMPVTGITPSEARDVAAFLYAQ